MLTVLPQIHQTAVTVVGCGSRRHCVFMWICRHGYVMPTERIPRQMVYKTNFLLKQQKEGLFSMSWVFSLNFKQLQILLLFMEEWIYLHFFPVFRTALWNYFIIALYLCVFWLGHSAFVWFGGWGGVFKCVWWRVHLGLTDVLWQYLFGWFLYVTHYNYKHIESLSYVYSVFNLAKT